MHAKFLRARRLKCRKALRALGVGGLLTDSVSDVSYLSGFEGEDSALLITAKSITLITDGRYDEQARNEVRGARIVLRKGAMYKAMAAEIRRSRIGKVAVESSSMSVATYNSLAKETGRGRLKPADSFLLKQRQVKDDHEVVLIRKATAIAEESFKSVQRYVKPGVSELELAGRLELAMKQRGASGASFPIIVARGARSSLPHATPSTARVRVNDIVLFDWGATYRGYRSDLTRVVGIGSIPRCICHIYPIVRTAQQSAIAAIRPGVTCKQVDDAARSVIAKEGYARKFVHGCGHGIGRDIHELPILSQRSDTALEAGMIVTVEPGIYLPNCGGVRIEDDVLVTRNGYRLLSRLSTHLVDWTR